MRLPFEPTLAMCVVHLYARHPKTNDLLDTYRSPSLLLPYNSLIHGIKLILINLMMLECQQQLAKVARKAI